MARGLWQPRVSMVAQKLWSRLTGPLCSALTPCWTLSSKNEADLVISLKEHIPVGEADV